MATLFLLLIVARTDENHVAVVLTLIVGVNAFVLMAVLPFVLGKFLFHQDVRAWLDARN